MKLNFPIIVEVTTVTTGKVEKITLTKKNKKDLKDGHVNNMFQLISHLDHCFSAPNFSWKIVQ